MAKTKTLDQLEGMRQKAVRFVRDVVGDPDRADEFASMSNEEYAAHKGIQVANPFSPSHRSIERKKTMAGKTRAQLEAQIDELKDRVDELEDENEDLSTRLDEIADLSTPEEDEDEEEGEEEGRD